jgi:tRNA(Ile2) C34 agmatinyltransferase TiaS
MTVKCTEYCYLEDSNDPRNRCHCPTCKGFLSGDIPDDKPFKCRKCGTELILIPDKDEETGKELEWGKICPISKPEKHFKKAEA